MVSVFLNALPFFALIALGFGAAYTKNFSKEATVHLTKFIFYFPLSAMIFNFASKLSLADIFEIKFAAAYLVGSLILYAATTFVEISRGVRFDLALIEGHCSVIGNMGWMGLAMLPILLGEASISYVIMVLICDLVVFFPLAIMLIVGHREGRMDLGLIKNVVLGLLKNPMILSILAGLIWSSLAIEIPEVLDHFLSLLGAASTPGALFAIGASMMFAERGQYTMPGIISVNKLVLHPVIVSLCALLIFDLSAFQTAVLASCAAMPVAGNIYMLANHYNIPSDRVSFAILISTLVSVFTIPLTIGLALSF